MLQAYTQQRILEQMIGELCDEEDAEMFRLLTRSYFIHSNSYTLLSNKEGLFSDSPNMCSFL